MIKTVNTLKMIQEYSETKNAPISFLCDDGELYYAKYIQDTIEFDCLIYEFFCNAFAKQLKIPVPESAFVHISVDSIAPDKIQNPKNKLFFKEGITAFGVKHIGPYDMLTNLPIAKTKREYNKLTNPQDLVLIALFDMHVGSRDRNPENYNILLTKGKRKTFFAIDHYDTFGGLTCLGNVKPNLAYSVDSTIFRADFVMKFIREYYDIQSIVKLIENYNYICDPNLIIDTLDELFDQVPPSWKLSATLKEKMLALLIDEARIKGIQDAALKFIQRIKKSY